MMSNRLTVDHKPNSPAEMERIVKLGGTVTNVGGVHRVQGDLSVCRALGDIHLKPYVSDVPDIFTLPLPRSKQQSPGGHSSFSMSSSSDCAPNDPNDACFLILACDGIWDELTDDVCPFGFLFDALSILTLSA